MQELDRRTIEEYGISGMVLMENAGRAVALEALKMLKSKKGSALTHHKNIRRVLEAKRSGIVHIICGSGNNGGDGFVAARHLFNSGVKVKVFYLGNLKEALAKTGDAATNLKIALKMRLPVMESTVKPLNGLNPSLIIDAIFGIGLTRPINGPIKELVESINRSKIPVIAVDVPSGLDCDKGIPLGIAIKADKTITFGAPKTGFKNKLAKKYLGKLIVSDISIPRFLF